MTERAEMGRTDNVSLAVPVGCFSGRPVNCGPHSGSPILLCAAVLGCSAQGLAAVPSNEVCSPKSPVLFSLIPLVPGATWRSWDWAVLQSLSMPPMGSSPWKPHGDNWTASHLQFLNRSTRRNSLAHPSIGLHSLLQSSPFQVTAALGGQLVQRPLLLSFMSF